jgi:hypothetical protein
MTLAPLEAACGIPGHIAVTAEYELDAGQSEDLLTDIGDWTAHVSRSIFILWLFADSVSVSSEWSQDALSIHRTEALLRPALPEPRDEEGP